MTGIFDARNAQGAINNAQANEINQNYGRQTTVDTDGGDAAGRDIVDNSVNIFLTVLGGNPEPNREPILNKLKKVLEEVDDPSIRQALRNCFKDRPIPTTEDTTEIIERLGLEQLLKLIASLLNENEKITQPVREELESITRSIQPNGMTPPPSSGFQKSRILQSYLLIVIRLEANPDNDKNKKCRINAWFIPDYDDTVSEQQKTSQVFQPLDLVDQEKGVACNFNEDEVSNKVNQFVEQSLEYLFGRQYQLIIEVFLPIEEHLNTKVEQWTVRDYDGESSPIGTKYQVLLRSCERIERKYLLYKWSDWSKNWDRVEKGKTPTLDDFYHLECIDDDNCKQLLIGLKEKIGLKVDCVVAKDNWRLLSTAVFRAASPITIWSRCNLPNQEVTTKINKLLIEGPLINLPEKVLERRLKAHNQTYPKEDMGYHLSILWENPYRLPPGVMDKLRSPGE